MPPHSKALRATPDVFLRLRVRHEAREGLFHNFLHLKRQGLIPLSFGNQSQE
jgi:hypothetical protein